MNDGLKCMCGSPMVSDGETWKCGLKDDGLFSHSTAVVDQRMGVQKPEAGDLVARVLLHPASKPGRQGLPGAKARRVRWKKPKLRRGTQADWERRNYQLARRSDRGWRVQRKPRDRQPYNAWNELNVVKPLRREKRVVNAWRDRA